MDLRYDRQMLRGMVTAVNLVGVSGLDDDDEPGPWRVFSLNRGLKCDEGRGAGDTVEAVIPQLDQLKLNLVMLFRVLNKPLPHWTQRGKPLATVCNALACFY